MPDIRAPDARFPFGPPYLATRERGEVRRQIGVEGDA
jgi:hypothetical protein